MENIPCAWKIYQISWTSSIFQEGLDLSKEGLKVSVGQRAAEPQAIKSRSRVVLLLDENMGVHSSVV